jgi:hypothetical protein
LYLRDLVAGAAILWSTAGLVVRLLDLDVWTMLAWRSAFTAFSLALVVIVQNRRDPLWGVRAIGWPGEEYFGYRGSLKIANCFECGLW